MKKVAFFLCFVMLLSLLSACVAPADNTPTTTVAPIGEPLQMLYDDRISLSVLTDEKKPDVTITDQQVTSKEVGTENADSNVLVYDEKEKSIVATGTGSAVLQVGDKVYNVTVDPAPISLFMITGHSIGAGQCGDAQLSVVCPDGMTYSSHGTDALKSVTSQSGIGFGSKKTIDGIDAFDPDGEGSIGEASALAWEWVKATNEKVWVLNAAVPGSCIPEWIPGEVFYENAVAMFKAAQNVLANEVAAGHYLLQDMAIIYHSGTNFVNPAIGNNYTYTQEDLKNWYDAMWGGFKTEFSKDIKGTGTAQTVSAIGLVPIFTRSYTTGFYGDVPANFFQSASADYSEYFIASDIGRKWLTNEDLKTYFPAPAYETHMGTPQALTTVEQIFVDGVHYSQIAYNALGMDVAKQLFTALRGTFTFNSITLEDDASNPIGDTYTLAKGASVSIVPQVDETGAGNMEFTVSGNINISFPCVITGTAPGTGTLEISRDGAVVKTVTFTVQ